MLENDFIKKRKDFVGPPPPHLEEIFCTMKHGGIKYSQSLGIFSIGTYFLDNFI